MGVGGGKAEGRRERAGVLPLRGSAIVSSMVDRSRRRAALSQVSLSARVSIPGPQSSRQP